MTSIERPLNFISATIIHGNRERNVPCIHDTTRLLTAMSYQSIHWKSITAQARRLYLTYVTLMIQQQAISSNKCQQINSPARSHDYLCISSGRSLTHKTHWCMYILCCGAYRRAHRWVLRFYSCLMPIQDWHICVPACIRPWVQHGDWEQAQKDLGRFHSSGDKQIIDGKADEWLSMSGF